MDPIYILFAATGLIFWILLVLSSIAIIASIENDSPSWATSTIALMFAILYFFSDFSVRYTWHFDWRFAATYLIGYIIIGIVWSVFKWLLSLSARRERWDEAVSEYKKQNQIDPKTVVSKKDPALIEYMKVNHREFLIVPNSSVWAPSGNLNSAYLEPRPEPNKARIILWMTYWPWSILWSLLDDIIRGIGRNLYRWLKSLYESMATWMFSDIS